MADVLIERSADGRELAAMRLTVDVGGILVAEVDDASPGEAKVFRCDPANLRLLKAVVDTLCANENYASQHQDTEAGRYLHLREDHVNARLGAAMAQGF